MTFCVGAKVAGGLVGLADTRIVKGNEQSSKSKVARLSHATGPLFVMTSGLRSVRDKTCTYFERALAQGDSPTQMFEAANAFGAQVRRVREEDGEALAKSKYAFNLHAIIGGQLENDLQPALFYVYPEGNWVEATPDAPYHVIGRSSYGKPILDRLLHATSSLEHALALSFLAFDATRASVTDVDFPIDVVVLDAQAGDLREARFDSAGLAEAAEWWQRKLRTALDEFPLDWAAELLTRNT